MTDCIFCKIVSNELPSNKVYENELLIAFMDIRPINPGHLLIVPKAHAENIGDVPTETAGKMFQLAKQLFSALQMSELKPDGVNLLLSNGQAAGQEVFHAHLHVIPRYQNDAFKFTFPTAEGNIDFESLAKNASILKEALKQD